MWGFGRIGGVAKIRGGGLSLRIADHACQTLHPGLIAAHIKTTLTANTERLVLPPILDISAPLPAESPQPSASPPPSPAASPQQPAPDSEA